MFKDKFNTVVEAFIKNFQINLFCDLSHRILSAVNFVSIHKILVIYCIVKLTLFFYLKNERFIKIEDFLYKTQNFVS